MTGYATALLFVHDVERSIGFYERIGFHIVDVENHAGTTSWARMHTDDGSAIMFARSDEGVARGEGGFVLVLYTPDLPSLRQRLLDAGVQSSAIEYPPWMPSGTLILRDPDGYSVGINHWSDKEHAAWVAALERKRAAGIIPTTA